MESTDKKDKTAPRMILIDDDTDSLEQLAGAVRNLGISCLAVSDPGAAVAKLGRDHFDIVVTDMKMPGTSGIAIVEAARAGNPASVIIAISGSLEKHVERNALKHGADVFMPKPLDLFAFMEELSRRTAFFGTDTGQ